VFYHKKPTKCCSCESENHLFTKPCGAGVSASDNGSNVTSHAKLSPALVNIYSCRVWLSYQGPVR